MVSCKPTFLNVHKTYTVEFCPKDTTTSFENKINYNNKIIPNTMGLKFLGLILRNIMSWKRHIDLIISQWNKACYIARTIKPFLSINSLKMIYHAYFYSVMSHGLIFWGTYSCKLNIFWLQKEWLEFWWEQDSGTPARNCLKL